MSVYLDQLNREINLDYIPKRIISIVPSQTELLFYLGLDDELIGITKFCTHPQNKIFHKIKVGGTKQLDISLIKKLNPDLIIANKEENERIQVEKLIEDFPVWISDINNLTNAVNMIKVVGEMINRKDEATKLNQEIAHNFNHLIKVPQSLNVVYLIWRKPYMVAGAGTYIDSMLKLCGFINVINLDRYPEIDANTLIKINPDVVMLSSEPYPFSEKHIREFQLLLPKAKIVLVDGEMFSWYGSRLLLAPEYFNKLIENNIS